MCAAIFIKGGIRETQYNPGPCGHVGKTGPVCSPRKPGRGLRSDRSRIGIGVPSTMTTSVEAAASTAVGQNHLPLASAPYNSGPPTSSESVTGRRCRPKRHRSAAQRTSQNQHPGTEKAVPEPAERLWARSWAGTAPVPIFLYFLITYSKNWRRGGLPTQAPAPSK